MTVRDPTHLRRLLFKWYGIHGRALPWRVSTHEHPDPYRVWVTEVMLQQTRVVTATPFIQAFLGRWPTVQRLAAAPLGDVLAAWAGLGYYARARNLHRCAKTVAGDLGGAFPDTESGLRALPGVGPYTAAAIAAIAFGRQTAAVDGNVKRVLARLYGIQTPLPDAIPDLRDLADALVPARRPGDWAQAIMDLGATICTPRRASCGVCPWSRDCAAHAQGLANELPRRASAVARPTRHGAAFWLTRAGGAVLLRRRPPSGLLGGMLGLPSTPWGGEEWTKTTALAFAPAGVQWRRVPGIVRHTFTHFHLALVVFAGHMGSRDSAIPGQWIAPADLERAGLPTLMKKAAGLVGARQN